jgi:PKD repeat protein
LLLPGNLIAPREPHNPDYSWYRDNIAVNLPALGYSTSQQLPILKLEKGGYCERIGSDECYEADGHSSIPIYENGTVVRMKDEINEGEVLPGDHVKITGVYAIDYAHSWWSEVCEELSTRMRGGLKVCAAHAEFHPYWSNRDDPEKAIILLEPLKPGKPNVESHTVVAPIFPDFYSSTWPPNIVGGLACTNGLDIVETIQRVRARLGLPPIPCDYTTLLDSSVQTVKTSEFFVEAPQKPTECTADVPCQMTLQESDIKKSGQARLLEKVRQDNGWLIKIQATGGDPWNPSIYQSTWSVSWAIGPDNVDPDTTITSARDGRGRELLGQPNPISISNSISFTFTGTDNNTGVVGFECSLDGSAPSPCTEGRKGYSGLAAGTHTFQVAAIDAASNVDETPATFTWRADPENFPPICIVRPWLPQCDPNQQSLTTRETTPPPSEQEAASTATTTTENQTMTEEPSGTTTTTTENEPEQEPSDITVSPEAQAVTEPLTVQIIPNATQGIVPATFQFDANIAGGTEPYTITWNIGEDRTEGDEERVLHTFEEAGTYNVTLTATDSQGETLSDSIEVEVLEPEEEAEPLEEGDEEGDEEGITNGEADEGDEENTET